MSRSITPTPTANYLSVEPIYRLDNPLLREPLHLEHAKPRSLGHWGTIAGSNLIYAHLRRLIIERGLDAIYVIRPGDGGPDLVANAYPEGTYSEAYPQIAGNAVGLPPLLMQFSLPGRQPVLSYLGIEEAVAHCTRDLGIWEWASNEGQSHEGLPDALLACAGDAPTPKTLAAAALLREGLPTLKVRVVNVLDLMRVEPGTEHPHGLSGAQFDALFTPDRPVVFAYHGYPSLNHWRTYRRTNHASIRVRGYQEEGTTTPFDIVMLNGLDRLHPVIDVMQPVLGLSAAAAPPRQLMVDERLRTRAYTRAHGEDGPAVSDWTRPYEGATSS